MNTKTITITDPADWKEGDMVERVWPDGSMARGVLRGSTYSGLRFGLCGHFARYAAGDVPYDGSTITVTREVPDRVLPTTLGAVILVSMLRGVTLEPPVLAMLDDCEDWATATLVAGMQYHGSEHIQEWEPAIILPMEDVERARGIVDAALRKVSINYDWSTISGDNLRAIRDALTEVQA